MVAKRFTIVSTSRTIGIFFNTIVLLLNIVAARIGSVAFFEPEIGIDPNIFFTNNFQLFH